jgi:sporulation-control protein
MLKNMLASIGFGGTKVDAVVDTPTVEAGSQLTGTIHIKGGDVEQHIDAILLDLVCKYIVETRDDHKVYGEITVATTGTWLDRNIRPGEHRKLDFKLQVPVFAPLSLGSTDTVLRTRLVRLDMPWSAPDSS